MIRKISEIAIVLVLCATVLGQTKSFTPVEGANLKAKIENAIITGKANAPAGRFWVGYQFEVRPGVGVDFEIVDSAGGIYISTDGTSMVFDPRHETRELGVFEVELQKQAVIAIGRRAKDEAIPILIRTARSHPKMAVRKVAIQMLGQTGDERAVAFFRELLSKD